MGEPVPLQPDDIEEIQTAAQRWIDHHWGATMDPARCRGMARDVLRLIAHYERKLAAASGTLLSDQEMLRLQDMLHGEVENMLRSSHYGMTSLKNEDVQQLYSVVMQARRSARTERERFAEWCRRAAKFYNAKGTSGEDPEQLTMAHVYNKLAHQLEENYLPEIPTE